MEPFTDEEIEHLYDVVDEYLGGLRTTLWGQGFDIISLNGRHRAADWLVQQIVGVFRTEASHQ